MTTSPSAAAKIKGFESCRLSPYNDLSGNATVGWGHLLHKGPCTPDDKPVSQEKADELFLSDLKTRAEVFIQKYVRVPLNQNQFDSLVSFTYNLGCGTLLNLVSDTGLNQGKYENVPLHLVLYNKSHVNGVLIPEPGLTRRRQWEAELFATPVGG